MTELFLNILNMSIIASYVALAVILARLFLKKAPKIFSYALWAIVLFRLISPFSLESSLSLIPSNPDVIPQDIIYAQNPAVNSGIFNNAINSSIQSSLPPVDPAASVNPIGVLIEISAIVWLIGIIVLLCYGIISYIRLKQGISLSTIVKGNIFESDRIKTPFILGFIKPKIYLPTNLSEKELDYILKHEQTHIKRKDYLIKPIAFLALILHWFNPLMWFSYFLMVKDMEMSCDESVLRNTDSDIRGNYSESLLSFSVRRSGLLIPLAFGESNVKSRIKNVLNYRKPTFWVTSIAIIILIALVLSLTVNPKNNEPDLSLLSINNALSSIATSTDVIVGLEDNSLLTFKPNGEFLNSFNQNSWKKKKVNSPLESIPTLIFHINDGYYINLYSSENVAMIYCDANNEKYRYYTIPKGTYDAVLDYVMQYGAPFYSGIDLLNEEPMIPDDIATLIENNLQIIMSSPLDSSRPEDYIDAHRGEYENILKQGDNALNYLLSQFEKGDSNGLRGNIMMQLCKNLLGNRNNVENQTLSPQEWYNALLIIEETKLPDFKYTGSNTIEKLVYDTEIEQNKNPYRGGFVVVAPKVHAYYEEGNKLKVFVTTYSSSYHLYGKILSEDGGGVTPAAITYVKDEEGNYSLEKYEQAMDGSFFAKSIRDYSTMPVSGKKIDGLADKILKYYRDYSDIIILLRENLIKHLEYNNLDDIMIKTVNGDIEPLT